MAYTKTPGKDLTIDLPEGFTAHVFPIAVPGSYPSAIEIRDTSRPLQHQPTKHQLVARVFENGKLVMWRIGDMRGFVHYLDSFDEARDYVVSLLRLGMYYENMPDIFTRYI